MRKPILFAAVLAAAGLSASAAISFAEGQATEGKRDEGAGTTLSKQDREFVDKASQGGLLEVRLGQLAQERAQHMEVKKFGQRMVDDHSAANKRLIAIAQQKGINVSQELDEKHRDVVDKLSKKTGAEFDKDYMSEMVDDHERDVKEFEKASKELKDADLKSFASTTLPTLREHLTLARQVHAKVKGK